MSFNKITSGILSSFKLIVGDDAVITSYADLEKYSHDETEDLHYYPEVVVKPKTPQERAALMRLCKENLIPVTPRGAGTGLSGGALPVMGGLLISMERFNKVLTIDEQTRSINIYHQRRQQRSINNTYQRSNANPQTWM